MPHLEVSQNHTPPSASLQQQAKGSSDPPFDARLIDTLLVFWPAKLVDLSHLITDRVVADEGLPRTTLLIGHVVPGHPHEAAALIIGKARSPSIAAARTEITQNGLAILGTLYSTDDEDAKQGPHAGEGFIWITTASPGSEPPELASVRLGAASAANGARPASSRDAVPCAISVIQYAAPNSRMMQYFALDSLRLAPVSGMKLVSVASTLLGPDAQLSQLSSRMAVDAAPSSLEEKFLRLLLLDPLHWRSLKRVQPHQDRMPRGTSLRRSIELINGLQHVYAQLAHRSAPKLLANGSGPESSKTTHRTSARVQVRRLGRVLTLFALGVQTVLRHPLYQPRGDVPWARNQSTGAGQPHTKPAMLSLVSISACARQLDTRISQLVVAPRLASRLRQLRKQQRLGMDELAAPYIGLWNAIWLIANDVILGHAASVLLVHNAAPLAALGRGLVERYLVQGVVELLSWLESWPVGLKLNTELSLFLGDAYASLTHAWHTQGLVHVLPRLEGLVVATALVGRWMGVTMVLCVVQDVVSICTLHITMFSTLSFRTLRAFVYVLSALFDVFRGKKRNALRDGRLDEASYEPDQLLLGTLLFTLMAFLLPTVYVYYLALGLARFGVVAFEVGVIQTSLGLLNHLPLFAIMLRLKDPHRLPAGVWLQPLSVPSGKTTLRTARFRLRTRALAMCDIFEGYGEHVGGLIEVPSMLLRCILGQPLRRPVVGA